MASKPKAPSGLGITRSGNTFTFKWTKGANYSQQLLHHYRNGKRTGIINNIASSVTSKAITIDLANWYYPKAGKGKLTGVSFYVKGYKSKWSDWGNKYYAINVPPKPILTTEHSDENENRTKFSWGINWGNSSRTTSLSIFKNYQWWTSLLPNSELTPEQVTDWQETGITSYDVDSGSKTIDETQVFEDNYSYTRYFKLVARGPAGDSKPSYASHVYAFPNAARNVSAYATRIESNQGYRVSVQWVADVSRSRPIDSVQIEYAIETPDSSVSTVDGIKKTTLSVPTISSWTTVSTLKDTTDTNGDVDGAAFVISGNIANDKCIFVRVVTKHDNKTSPSAIVFVSGGYGALTAPSGLSATIDDNVATVAVTNNSAVSASFVGIYYRTELDPTPVLVGVKPAGSSASVSVQLPDTGESNEVSLGVRTFVADYSPATPAQSGVTEYAVGDSIMESSGIVWDNRPVPKPPSNITLASPKTGVVRVTWDWTWTAANGVELSWADHDDAWESTDGPQTYILENTRACAWNVADLDVGTWYFRVRLFKTDADATTYGTYSDVKSIKLASTPPTPVLTVSPSITPPDGKVTCYWAFSATDGDNQAYADIREVTLNSSGVPTTYTDIGAKAENEQYKSIDISKLGWAAGSTHYLAVKIITISGEESDNWSLPKPIKILEPVTCTITSTSLTNVTVVDDEEQGISHTQLSLTEMPLTVTATGAGESGTMTYILERGDDYHLDRPDESEFTGFNGETIAMIKSTGTSDYSVSSDTVVDTAKAYYVRTGSGTSESPYEYTVVSNIYELSADISVVEGKVYYSYDSETQIYNIVESTGEENPSSEGWYELKDPSSEGWYETTGYVYNTSINLSDLVGPLDDNAKYNLLAIAQDSNGQVSEAATIPFEVHWIHKAVAPEAAIEVDKEEMVTYITTIQPDTGYVEGDTCDIYRLSTDRPELIVQDAAFGTKYVDPYPTLGKMGGHRIVYKTAAGSYITDDKEFAWTDYDSESDDILDIFATIIDFGDGQVVLPYDLSLSSKWSKDFTMTKYLGGSVEGDWNPAVERTGTVKTRVAVEYDSDLIVLMRKLASYAGVCHVRTPDGSSFAANVNVTEDREEKKINMIASFSMEITKIDSEGFDGIVYDEWIIENN